MALTITKTDEAPLTIKGTSIELPSVYARIELAASPNGVDMQMGMYYYEDKAAFQAAQGVLKVNELQDLFNGAADLEQSESQSVQLASEKVKAQLEAKGYTVAIVDL